MYAVRLKEISDVLALVMSSPSTAGKERARELFLRAAATIREAGAECPEEGFREQVDRMTALFEEAVRSGVTAVGSPEASAFIDAAARPVPRVPSEPDHGAPEPARPVGREVPTEAPANPGPAACGELLVRARSRRGMKQKDLAAELGISQGYLCRIEKGRCPAPAGELGRSMRRFIHSSGLAQEPGSPVSSALDRSPMKAEAAPGGGPGDAGRRADGREVEGSGKQLLVELLDVCSRLPDAELKELIRAARSLRGAGPPAP